MRPLSFSASRRAWKCAETWSRRSMGEEGEEGVVVVVVVDGAGVMWVWKVSLKRWR